MGLFSAFKKGFNSGSKRAHEEAVARRERSLSEVVKLVETSSGRTVKFEVIAEGHSLKTYIGQLTSLAELVAAEVSVEGKNVTFICPNSVVADELRETWK